VKKFIFPAAVLTLMVSGFSHAGVIISDTTACMTESVQITAITPVFPAGDNIVPADTAIDSTSCLGFIVDPSNDWGEDPDPNKGGLGDGLLNGEYSKDGYFIPGEQFLTNEDDSMVNLDGLGEADDPGWIRLGGFEVDEDNWNFQYDSIGDYNLGSVIDMSFNNDGTWSLAVDPAAIAFATAALGRPSVFDHLAFVLKGPNKDKEAGSWAIYDFNFHDLIDDGWDVSLGDTAYTFEGKWDTDLFVNDNALSHMSVWAHDPPAESTYVPEPSTLAIFALSLIGLASRRFKKH